LKHVEVHSINRCPFKKELFAILHIWTMGKDIVLPSIKCRRHKVSLNW
jgi:hypothetical protein